MLYYSVRNLSHSEVSLATNVRVNRDEEQHHGQAIRSAGIAQAVR